MNRTLSQTAGFITALLIIILWAGPGYGFAGGTGQANDPYQIATAEQLVSIGDDPNLLDKHFVLIADIDLDPNLPGRRVFTQAVIAPGDDRWYFPYDYPHGPDRFTGHFDGRRHAIRRLTIRSDGGFYLGLFGGTGEGAWIHDLRIEDASIAGGAGCRYVGVLAGLSEWCVVTNCSVTGRVQGGDGAASIGGLVGVAGEYTRIAQCGASCDMIGGDGTEDLGGLAGSSGGTIIDCYCGADVSAGADSKSIGGLVGDNTPRFYNIALAGRLLRCCRTGSITTGNDSNDVGGLVGKGWPSRTVDSFWDIEASGLAEGVGGTGLTTAEMQRADTYSAAGWDLAGKRANGTADLWLVAEGGYPVLAVLSESYPRRALAGSGTPDDPYRIASAEDLGAINHYDPLANYRLEADVDLTGITWQRAPLGCFAGGLDGGGFEISNLTVQGHDYLGVFAQLYEPAEVANLRITDANVVSAKNYGYVGGLAGRNEGRIVDCQIDCHVAGEYGVGGLVGINAEAGRIVGSNSRANVAGGDRDAGFGGLAGFNDGSIIDCHAEAAVTGYWGTGGLVGCNDGLVRGCYACGHTQGEPVGGLVGENAGAIFGSYAVVDVYMHYWYFYPGGLVGKNDGSIVRCYAAGAIVQSVRDEPALGGLVGGFGPLRMRGTVVNSFWDTEAGACDYSQGGRGLTTAEMMDPDTYVLNGWAGDPNWVLDPGRDYPRLAWQGTPGEPIPAPSIDWFEGSGAPEDPYRIETPEQLASIGTASILWDKAFVLVSDLDLSGIHVPRIGVCRGTDFSGTFEGAGHTISGLSVGARDASATSLGLFGRVGRKGRLSRLTLREALVETGPGSDTVACLAGANEGLITQCAVIDSNCAAWQTIGLLAGLNDGSMHFCSATGNVSGGQYSESLGGLVGENRSEITRCWAEATVDGARQIGGLVGYNEGAISESFAASRASGRGSVGGLIGKHLGTVTNSYATGDVTGLSKSWGVAGLVGLFYEGAIVNCYATGRFRGGAGSEHFGGLVGYDWIGGPVTSCFWDINTSGLTISAGGTGLTTAKMQDPNTFLDAAWDLVGERGNGTADVWFIPEGGGYPELTALSDSFVPRQLSGSGTIDDPYKIASAEDLGAINHYDPQACYQLTADVDLVGITWRQAPVRLFDGSFDGAGHVVSNLRAPLAWDFGLFGELGRDAVVTQLGLADFDITAADGRAGMLAARNLGHVEQCYATGAIGGFGTFGGLVGDNGGTVRDSYVTGVVTGEDDYVTNMGGLAGTSNGTIDRCYAAATVLGKAVQLRHGGLVSRTWSRDGPVTDSYFLSESDGGGPSNGLGVKLSDDDMRRQASFAGWDFDTVWTICEGEGYPRLQWENVDCAEEEP